MKRSEKNVKTLPPFRTALCHMLTLFLLLQTISPALLARERGTSGSSESRKKLPPFPTSQSPALTAVEPNEATQGQSITVTLHGSNTTWEAVKTRASFGPEISVGGASAGELGPITVVNATTATAQITVSQTTALGPRTVRVFTDQDNNSGDEDITLSDGFNINAFTVPGSTAWAVATIAGEAGTSGFADGPVSQAQFNTPTSIAVASDNTIYVADSGNNRIRKIDTAGTVTTVAGDGTAGLQDGPGSSARFNAPRGVVADKSGNLWVTDTGNHAVRKVTQAGVVSTVAGSGNAGANDSPNPLFNGPTGITTDSLGVFVYLTDTNNQRIRKVDASGTTSTLIGLDHGFADGKRLVAKFADPSGIAVDDSGKLIVADAGNSLIRVVDPELAASGEPGAAITRAGTGRHGSADGPGSVAMFSSPRGVAVTSSGTVIIADTGNHTLRKILRPPVISSFNPTQATAPSDITINGSNFDASWPGRNTVKFTKVGGGQTQAQVTAATETQLTVTIPADAATGPVTVQTAGGTAVSPASFVVTGSSPAPFITSFSPAHGPPGTTVTLLGDSLTAQTGSTTVTFLSGGGSRIPATVTLASQTEVRVVVPSGAATGTIELTNALGTAATSSPFIVDPPVQDFQIAVAPSTAQAVQGTTATYVVSLTSALPSFTQMAVLSTTGLPLGVVVSFSPAQITAGATSTVRLDLSHAALATGNYPFTIRATTSLGGADTVRTAAATLSGIGSGQTTLSGRALSTNSEPILGATVSLDGKSTVTDAAGNFLLTDVTQRKMLNLA